MQTTASLSSLRFMFKLIQSALFEVPLSADELVGADWREIYAQAKKQTVLGIVGDAIGRLTAEMVIPKEIKEKFLTAALINIRTHALLDRTVAEVVDFYRKHGIEGVVLKGQGVARYYPDAHMRQCGDIDFYICNGAFERAKDLAVVHWLGGKEVRVQETYKHFGFEVGPVEVELHRIPTVVKRPWHKWKFRRWFDAGLEDDSALRRIDIEGVRVSLPSTKFDALYIFYHVFSHLVGNEGIGLRQLCDWAMVLHRFHASSGDRESIVKTIRSFGLERPWQIMGFILVQHLGLPKEEMPLYSEEYKAQSLRLLDQILEGGNFGKYSSDNHRRPVKGYWRRKLSTYRTFHKNLSKMWYLSPTDVVGSYLWFTTTGLVRAIITKLT